MIKPMIRPIIRPIIRTIINPDLEQRAFIELDSLLMSYYDLDSPETFTGDFEIPFKFQSTNTAIEMGIFGYPDSTPHYLRVRADGRLQYQDSSNNEIFDAGFEIRDGKLRSGILRRIGTSLDIILDDTPIGAQVVTVAGFNVKFIGASANTTVASSFFSGILADTLGFKLDKISGNSLEGNNSYTGINIPVTNVEQFKLNGNLTQWDNISPAPQVLPATIQIAS